MRIDIFTLIPEIFPAYLNASIIARAQQSGLLEVGLHNIRDYITDKHHQTDDVPYGGGGGMVMKAEPIFSAVENVLGQPLACPVILLTPQGRPFSQKIARQLATLPHFALLCGRYEGVDERVRQYLVSDELSIGDYVLTGGELAALVVLDAVTRLQPGALGDPDAPDKDSHAAHLLEYPHYTRPATFREWETPPVLLSGDHARIARWRREQSLIRTAQRRPDLLAQANLSEEERRFIQSLLDQQGEEDGN